MIHIFIIITLIGVANIVHSTSAEPRQINLREPNNPDLVEAIAQGLIQRYSGDGANSSATDQQFGEHSNHHFRLLELDGDHLLIGAADSVHNVSISTFQSVNIFHWAPGPEEHGECQMKSMDESLCRNFVRVLGRLGQGRLLVCGTNALRPACRILSPQWETVNELAGTGLAPSDPAQNSSHLLTVPGDMLYSATVADLAGTDPLLFCRNVSDPSDRGLRTQRGNALQLDRPQFVGTLQNEEFVYLFFREDAAEADFQPATFSRVARVCKSDRGGPGRHYGQEWTSFVKARLNCSIAAGNSGRPFYFDQLIAISPPVHQDLVYATFVSEFDFLRHSVVCAFRLGQIDAIFRSGPYLGMDLAGSGRKWAPKARDDLTAGLGQCRADSERMSEDEALARRKFPLMADSVQNTLPRGAAAGIHRGSDHYSQIAVLPSVIHNTGQSDVLYVATDQGNVLKLINIWPANEEAAQNSSGIPHQNGKMPSSMDDPLVPVATFQLANSPIRRLLISSQHRALIVVTDSTVFRLPLHFCGFHQSCTECVGSRDPHCVWHAGKCKGREDIDEKDVGKRQTMNATPFLQDVLAKNGGGQQLCVGMDEEDKQSGRKHSSDDLVGGQKTLKMRPNSGKLGGGCECADKQNGRKCECHSNNGQQQQFLMMEEPKRRVAGTMIGGTSTEGTTGKIGWGDQLKALPWWVHLLALLAILQPLAFVWLICRWYARRRAGKLSRDGVGPIATKYGPHHSNRHLCSSSKGSSGGLISAYSPASILSGPIGGGGPKDGNNIWTSRTTTTISSNSGSPTTPIRSTPSASPKGSAGEFIGIIGTQQSAVGMRPTTTMTMNEANGGTGRRGAGSRFTLQGWSLMPPRRASIGGGEISVQLDGSAAPSAGLMTLPLHLPPQQSSQYHQIYSHHPSMSTFSGGYGTIRR